MSMSKTVVFVLVLLVASNSSAQPTPGWVEKPSWGVSADLTPHWELMPLLKNLFEDDVDLRGRELRLGFVRGKAWGGDWGVSFVWAPIKDGSFIKEASTYQFCMGPNCSQVDVGKRYFFYDASLIGLEVHKYVPFVTFADRVQLGMNFGGGALWIRGMAEEHHVRGQVTIRRDNGFDLRAVDTVSDVTAAEVFKHKVGTSVIPTGRLEAMVGIIINECLKIKVGGGVNLPSQHLLTVGAVWLF